MDSPFSLSKKTVLVTGASSGIGRATAIECSKMGAKIILNGRSLDALNETLSQLHGDSHIVCAGDLTDDSHRNDLIASVPKLDGVVLNAGVSQMKLVQFITLGDLEKTFSLNTFSPMLLLKGLVCKKKLNNPSSVVFTASISGFSNVSPASSIYGSSKAALSTYMKYAALELAGKGIRCNAIHPGRVITPLIEHSMLSSEDTNKDLEKYPLKRYGKPQEVAWSVIYLLSDASAWITGTNLVLDGGRSLI